MNLWQKFCRIVPAGARRGTRVSGDTYLDDLAREREAASERWLALLRDKTADRGDVQVAYWDLQFIQNRHNHALADEYLMRGGKK